MTKKPFFTRLALEQTFTAWRTLLVISLCTLLIIGGFAFLYFGQWWSAILIWLLAGLVFRLNAVYQIIQQFTSNLTRLVSGERDVHFSPSDTTPAGTLGRTLNIVSERVRRLENKRDRDRDRLNTLLTRMAGGALLLNRHGRVRLINPAAAEFLRVKPDQVIRKSLVQVVWDYRINEVWQRSVKSGLEENETIDLDSGRSVRVTVSHFLKGADRGYLVLLQDLSHMRRLERIRRDFVSNVSHEMRTPLASLRALVETLRDDALDDPPAAIHFLGRIEVEVDKMTQMVEELLELTRIESGQFPLRLANTTVDAIVRPSVERLRPQAQRADVAIEIDLPTDLPQVLADVERMHQVVINIIHNAIKFTPSGGKITVSASQAEDQMIAVSVKDTGVGIPERDLSRIFERFYKADRARSGGGTGFGLAISKHIVQAHHGEIWAESVEGEGSTFSFTLPTAT